MRKIWVVLLIVFVGILGSITVANYWLKHRMEKEEARPSAPKNPSLLYPTRIQNKVEKAPAPKKARPSPKSSPQGTPEEKIIYQFPLDDAILVQ